MQLWEQLLELLKRRRSRLEKSMKLQRIFQEMINAIDWMDEIKVEIQIQKNRLILLTCTGFLSSFLG